MVHGLHSTLKKRKEKVNLFQLSKEDGLQFRSRRWTKWIPIFIPYRERERMRQIKKKILITNKYFSL